MRYNPSTILVILLISFVKGSPALRAPFLEEDGASFRGLENGSNETEAEDPPELLENGEGEENPSVNETEPSQTPPTATEVLTPVPTVAPVAATNPPTTNTDTNSTSEANTPTPTAMVPATESPTTAPSEDDEFEDEDDEFVEGEDDEFVEGEDDEFGEDEDDEFAEDDEFEDDDYGEGHGEGWGSETEETRTTAPYVPPTGDDPFAKEPDESEWTGQDWKQETPEEMMHDKNVIAAVVAAAVFAMLCGCVLAICAAQQVIENPDGCCASICRCASCFFCSPCRLCCGSKDRRTHDLMIGNSDSYTHDLELT